MTGFGERLKKLRREADITQTDLASYLGIVPSAVGKYERLPNAYPTVEVLVKIADYFKVSLDYLLKGVKTAPIVETNIGGVVANSSFIQANHGGVIVSNKELSPEALGLVHIYEKLESRDRLELINFAVGLEKKAQ